MNFPNKLTTLRMILIVVLLGIYFLPLKILETTLYISIKDWSILIIFIVASLTDFFDGYYARKYHLITTYGKFMDPLADKLLVNITLLLLILDARVHPLVFILMFIRDIAVDGLRMLSSSKGVVIAAGQLGKAKTALQMVAIISIYLKIPIISTVLIYLALIMSLLSGMLYLYNGRKIILESI